MRVKTDSCDSCGSIRGERHKATEKPPTVARMERWVNNGGAKATDGCVTDPDGFCEHGHQSWLLRLGMI